MNLRTKKQKVVATICTILALLVIAYGYQCGWHKVCGNTLIEQRVRSSASITTPHKVLDVEVVDTKDAMERGLSGRKGIVDNDGMLFVFPREGQLPFWMKDMLFSIDIVWLNASGTVVYVERNVSPDSYKKNPPEVFVNSAPATYVLEVGSGKAEEYGLYLGSKVTIAR